MPHGSFKETFRALSDYFKQAFPPPQGEEEKARPLSSDITTITTATTTESSSPLPPSFPSELYLQIDAFLSQHGYDSNSISGSSGSSSSNKKPDERDSQRLQDELRSLYSQYVVSAAPLKTERQQAQQQYRHGSFLRLVRLLRPMLVSEAQLLEWWDRAIRPVIEGVGSVGSTRVMLREAGDCALSFMLPLEGSDRDVNRLSSEKIGGKGKELGNETRSGEKEMETAQSFMRRAINAYLNRTRACPIGEKGLVTQDEYIACEWRNIIVRAGRTRLKLFLGVINTYLIDASTRYEILRLLSTFMEQEVPHLHLVQDTPLIENLLRCLLIDKITTIVSSALTVLITFMPHIPSAAIAHLPKLFLVYSRILCWENSQPVSVSRKGDENFDTIRKSPGDNSAPDSERNHPLLIDHTWIQALPDENSSSAPAPSPDVMPYFTLLYGLYPLNLMSFINRPRKYLKTANYPEIDHIDLDKPIMRSRSDSLRQAHLIHPNFLRLSIEQELTENRWMKMEAAEVLLECLQLSTSFSKTPADGSSKSQHWSSLSSSSRDGDDNCSFKSSKSEIETKNHVMSVDKVENENSSDRTRMMDRTEAASSTSAVNVGRISRESGVSSSTLSTLSTQRSSLTSLSQNERQPSEISLVAPESSLHESHAMAAAAATTSLQRQRSDSPTIAPPESRFVNQRSVSGPASSTKHNDKDTSKGELSSDTDIKNTDSFLSLERRLYSHQLEINCLRQEIASLRNDVSFERYLKQQYSVYISQLRKKKLEELRLETETENLIIENKNLKSGMAKVNENLIQLKREKATSRQHSKKYEESLIAKFKKLHKEHEELKQVNSNLEHEFEEAKSEQEKSTRLLHDSKVAEQKTSERLNVCQLELAGRKSLTEELSQMHEQVAKCENMEIRYRMLKFQLHSVQTELENAKQQIRSREVESNSLQQSSRAKIKELSSELANVKLKAAQESQMKLNSAMAADQEEMSMMRKEIERLRKKCQKQSYQLYAIEAEKKADAGIAAAKKRQQNTVKPVDGNDRHPDEGSNIKVMTREPD